ncbi:MAG: N-acetylmuramoyl-L-alanine amidase, partial [Thermoleophilaceae bacterium]|nr:N-acetylmuramoyl-L-alanine amidase [Thermoleophilaceae bacterium]
MNPTTLGDWRTVRVVTLAVIAAATGVAINIGSSGPTTISITVQGPSGPTALTTTAAAIEQLKSSQAGNHRGARDETPRGVTAKQLVAGSDQLKRLAASDDFPSLAPDAAPQTAGCRSRFVRNFSSRNGVKPRLIVLHLTASPNNGWTGVNAITGYFNEPATQVSSHYVVSGNGLCNYVVRETDKAWTQAAFN